VSNPTNEGLTRREAIKTVGQVAAATALAGMVVPAVHAAEDNTIRVALIGCGGRGTGAAGQALSTRSGPIKLVAMADIFQDRVEGNYKHLKEEFGDKVDVPPERRYVDFEGYKKAMSHLRPGDVAIFATPPAFRWAHFGHAVAKGLNVFMEKPVTVDGPSTRKLLKLAEESEKRNLKVGVGLMCRHCAARKQLLERIHQGEIGDIILMRAYRMEGPIAYFRSLPRNKNGSAPWDKSDLLYQIRRFHSFLWASGGCYSDFFIHNIDECCWMKGAWPVKAMASGGRQYRDKYIDQNFDHYSVEYTFGDGTKLLLEGRNIDGCKQRFASYAHGSKGSAIISSMSHTPAHCKIFKGQDVESKNYSWKCMSREPNPYQLEWDELIEAIRKDKPYNEARRGAQASLVTAMGRMAAHTGQEITYDQMLNCEQELGPNVDKLSFASEAPVMPDSQGKYPVPQPGIKKDREY
jgi:predicted dehydrogenase